MNKIVFNIKAFIFLALIFFSVDLFAQNPGDVFLISLKDKSNSKFSISKPDKFLSSLAIQRRINQHIIVQDDDLPVNVDYVKTLSNLGARVHYSSRWMNATIAEIDNSILLQKIADLPFVISVSLIKKSNSPNKNISLNKFNESKNSNMRMQVNNNFDYGASYNQISMLHGDSLHSAGFKGQGMIIAVLDAGFLHADSLPIFASLRANGQILGTWDFVEGNDSVYEDYNHGTAVLSIMGGNIPGSLIGTSPEAKFWLLRSEDVASESLLEEYNWIAAAEFADSVGADIITSSLGYSTFDNSSTNHTYADMNGSTTPITIGADKAFGKGMLVVNSAGNEGANDWNFIIAPADGKNVLAIGAVDAQEHYAFFSSNGPSSDGRVKPNVASEGMGTIVASSSGGVFSGNGTSFACPVISGMSACLWQAFPQATNQQIKNAIEQSASQFDNPDTLLGYGIPDYQRARKLLEGFKSIDPVTEKITGVYPNPFSSQFNFSFYSFQKQDIQFALFDLLGNQLSASFASVEDRGYYAFQLPSASETDRLPNGFYFLKVTSPGINYIIKLVKVKI